MEFIKITKEEYEKLLKYRDIVTRIEEDVHEELNLKPLRDKAAIKVMKKLDKDIREGNRRKITDEEFESKYKHLL
ncbi:hypothetical protein HY570_03640 [Candidatus Micrarchaeota archaeon]|nr:hypothetical protein [Candidatus Micrarchaeota archaeon]